VTGRTLDRMRSEVESLRHSIQSLSDAEFSLRNGGAKSQAEEVSRLRERVRRELIETQREYLGQVSV
jgi:hypothetical protein